MDHTLEMQHIQVFHRDRVHADTPWFPRESLWCKDVVKLCSTVPGKSVCKLEDSQIGRHRGILTLIGSQHRGLESEACALDLLTSVESEVGPLLWSQS